MNRRFLLCSFSCIRQLVIVVQNSVNKVLRTISKVYKDVKINYSIENIVDVIIIY